MSRVQARVRGVLIFRMGCLVFSLTALWVLWSALGSPESFVDAFGEDLFLARACFNHHRGVCSRVETLREVDRGFNTECTLAVDGVWHARVSPRCFKHFRR